LERAAQQKLKKKQLFSVDTSSGDKSGKPKRQPLDPNRFKKKPGKPLNKDMQTRIHKLQEKLKHKE